VFWSKLPNVRGGRRRGGHFIWRGLISGRIRYRWVGRIGTLGIQGFRLELLLWEVIRKHSIQKLLYTHYWTWCCYCQIFFPYHLCTYHLIRKRICPSISVAPKISSAARPLWNPLGSLRSGTSTLLFWFSPLMSPPLLLAPWVWVVIFDGVVWTFFGFRTFFSCIQWECFCYIY